MSCCRPSAGSPTRSDLRLSADHRTAQSSQTRFRCRSCKPQARLPRHAPSAIAVAAVCRPTGGQRHCLGVHPALVVRCAGNQLLEWRSRPHRLRDRHLRQGNHRLARTTAGVNGEMVRDLMLACVEQRLAATRAPHPVQWLADNGSLTPRGKHWSSPSHLVSLPASPWCEALRAMTSARPSSKTVRRDYARIQPRPDAATVLQMLPLRIDDYNQHHPHSGMQMRSVREFIQCRSQPARCPV